MKTKEELATDFVTGKRGVLGLDASFERELRIAFLAGFDARDDEVEKLQDKLATALEIIEKIPDYGPSEEPAPGACLCCDMGGSGRSSKGDGYHDDECIITRAREAIARIKGAK